jgi:hypothetical protein
MAPFPIPAPLTASAKAGKTAFFSAVLSTFCAVVQGKFGGQDAARDLSKSLTEFPTH